VLLRYLPLFLLFLLLHDYGKRFISDIVNSTTRFSNEQKELANFTLNVLQQSLVGSSSDFSTNPSSQTNPSSPDFSYRLRKLLGIWTLEGMEAVLLSFFRSQASFQTGQESNNLRQEVENWLVQFIENLQVNQGLAPITQVAETDQVTEANPQMAARWLLIMTHLGQGFLDVAETIINQLEQDNNLSPEDKVYITAIAVGVIAGHHTPGGDSGYPPVDVLVKVLEHCLNHLGIDSNAEFWSKAKDLMLFAAAFAKIIDVMQARCFDKRLYNQGTDPPLPTELQFGSQTSDTGGEKSQKLMDDFLKFLYDWIRQKAFPGSEKVGFDNHPIVTGYRSLRGAQQILLNLGSALMDLDSAPNSMRIGYGPIINGLLPILGIFA